MEKIRTGKMAAIRTKVNYQEIMNTKTKATKTNTKERMNIDMLVDKPS
jgi:hypothetical protein